MDHTVVLITPDHVPDELGGCYADACRALSLKAVPDGYVLYLLDVLNQRTTVIGPAVEEVRQAQENVGRGSLLAADLDTVLRTAESAGVVEVRPGWPEEFGGGPRCQFCRDPDPKWVYEGADVQVLIEASPQNRVPAVAGTEVTGCIDWHACGACRELIEAGTQGSWPQLLARYGQADVPMPVQAAWREFWGNHRPPRPAPAPPWSPGRRRLAANHVRTHWPEITAVHPLDDVVFTTEPDVPELAGLDAALDAARGYLLQTPPPGRIRRYPTEDPDSWIVRADGEDWSLIGAGSVALILTDAAAELLHPATGPRTESLLKDLAALVDTGA